MKQSNYSSVNMPKTLLGFYFKKCFPGLYKWIVLYLVLRLLEYSGSVVFPFVDRWIKLLRKIRIENRRRKEEERMEFFAATISVLKIVLTAIGAGIGIWGVVELLESYGDGGGSSRSKGIKQLMSGGGIIIVAQTVIPLMANLFTTGG